ncbi:response regulator transcription factor [Phenylobacterium sp.]|uniref:response regulator transcription factor n=1 Tax=Phenylobacterium sp. TaxID=1871053 RepID=UPI00272FF8CB|nr:response regulator [Phenylobacterium sp.]MDP1986042.1 response regulator [Phenylobacterium sp.]
MPAVSRPAPTIILLDDDAALRQALTFSLEIEGYQVMACETGDQLMAQVLPDHDACLVLDYRLENGTGLDTLETLRARGVALPAILITSHPKASVRERAARLQAALVEKPLLGDLLLARIHDILPLGL